MIADELDRLAQEYVDQMKCGRSEEAKRTLARRDELLLSELVSKSQIAALFGVSPSAVSNWTERHDDFPEPRIPGHYLCSEVIRWWAARHPDLIQRLEAR